MQLHSKVIVSMIALLLTFSFSFHLHAQTEIAQDEVRDMLATYQTETLAGHVDAAINFYAQDATVILWNGILLEGRTAIEKGMKQNRENAHPDDTMEVGSSTIKMLGENCAQIIIEVSGTSHYGDQVQAWEGYHTQILTRKDGQWKIQMEQFTPLVKPEW